MKEHVSGKTRTTIVLETNKLVYKEMYDRVEDARSREKKLKSYKSKKYIEWLISTNTGL